LFSNGHEFSSFLFVIKRGTFYRSNIFQALDRATNTRFLRAEFSAEFAALLQGACSQAIFNSIDGPESKAIAVLFLRSKGEKRSIGL